MVCTEPDSELYLNDIWTVYFHDPNDTDWTHSSYINLGNISTVDDFWNHHVGYREHAHKGMFFIMREHVFPSWDDPCNLTGGCLSIKVLKDDMNKFWEDLAIKMLGEDLLVDGYKDKWSCVNGISTSPKKHFCIIKIWLQNDELSNKSFFNLLLDYHGDILYKSNQDNISNDVKEVKDPTAFTGHKKQNFSNKEY